MEFLSLTRDVEIGANSYLLTLGGQRIILDSGMHPKKAGLESTPNFQLLGELPVDAIILTHAHQDHIGSLPFLTRMHQQAPVLMTEETYEIGEIMLHNSVNVMKRQRESLKLDDYPLFTHRGVDYCQENWIRVKRRKRYDLEGYLLAESAWSDKETSVEFYDAGHILGSAGVLLRHEGQTLFYTGDVHFEGQTIMQPADFPTEGVDVLVMETTRGDTPTPDGFTRKSEADRLMQSILAAFERGASVTIPVFALGKTQELLGMILEYRQRGELPDFPIYIGGLSTKIAQVYDATAETARRNLSGISLLENIVPSVASGRDIDTLKPKAGTLYALSSGMLTENTLSNIFVRHILEDENQALFFVGYSDPESPAGRLRATPQGGKVSLDERLGELERRCEIQEFTFSAHARRERLLEYAVKLHPKTILLVHGDTPAIKWFRKELEKQLPDTKILTPEPGRSITLS
ncbi:MAG: MBL fold metallo-hydrolase [Chthoniobacterales bacterium]